MTRTRSNSTASPDTPADTLPDSAPAGVLENLLLEAVAKQELLRLVLSSRSPDSRSDISKLTVRPVALRGETLYQIATQHGPQEKHRNLPALEMAASAAAHFGADLVQAQIQTVTADYALHIRPNGKLQQKQSPPSRKPQPTAHNRTRNYLIEEGTPCAFLEAVGVMTAVGQVRTAHRHKFRQINRYLEFVNDLLPQLPESGVLRVVDFGCGKSYLTFALHHLLTKVHGRDVDILGLDLKQSVIHDCNRIAGMLDCRGLRFAVGAIAAHQPDGPVHLAVSLHACDTATDDALAAAVRWQADAILAVPCCQHELAPQLENAGLQALLEHGILRERFATLATDALRAKALELCGYKTQVMEFIDLEHTPKNLLIRALRRAPRRQPEEAAAPPDPAALSAYRDLRTSLGINHFHLETALGNRLSASGTHQPPGRTDAQ